MTGSVESGREWTARARDLRNEVYALALVVRDSRAPWYAKAVGLATIGLAVSPLDPIPDFVPVLGYLDDLVLVPIGVYLVRRAVPDHLMEEAREQAVDDLDGSAAGWLVAAIVVLAWALLVVFGALLVAGEFRPAAFVYR